MRDHTGHFRGFFIARESWHFRPGNLDSQFDDIEIGMYSPEGGTSGEFSIRWVSLCGKEVPRLEVFNDGWSALSRFSDLLDVLSQEDDNDLTREEVKTILLQLGIKDITQRGK